MSGTMEEKKQTAEAQDKVQDAEAPKEPGDINLNAADKGQAISGYETLSVWQTAVKFKYASLACFFAPLSAAADGYQLS